MNTFSRIRAPADEPHDEQVKNLPILVQPGFTKTYKGRFLASYVWGTTTITTTVTSTTTTKLTAICKSTTAFQTCGSTG